MVIDLPCALSPGGRNVTDGEDNADESSDTAGVAPRYGFLRLCVITVAFLATLGLNLPLSTLYFEHRVCKDGGYSDCKDSAVSARAAKWSAASLGAMHGSMVFAIAWAGPRSDESGRRPLVLVPCIGAVFCYVATALVSAYHLPLWYIVAASAANGLCGANYLFSTGLYSAAVDLSTPSERTAHIGTIEGLVYLTITATTVVGGVAADTIGFTASFFGVAGFALAALVITAVAMPETLPGAAARREPYCGGRCGDTRRNLADVLRLLRWRPRALLLLVLMCGCMCIPLMTSNFVLITRHCFSWSRAVVGYLLASQHAAKALGAAVVLPWLKRRRSPLSDTTLLSAGLVCETVAWGLVGFFGPLHEGYGYWASQLLWLVAGWHFPLVKSLLSQTCHTSQQGKLFTLTSLGEAFTGMVSSPVMQEGVYATTVTRGCSGCVYYVGAGFAALALIILRCALPIRDVALDTHSPLQDPPEESGGEADGEILSAGDTAARSVSALSSVLIMHAPMRT